MTKSITAPYQVLPLEHLVESPVNPRKHFDQPKLEELAASIRAHGILTPLLVRPNPHANKKGYEIAAGHRRYRAALLAWGPEGTAPCIVRDLDDQAFLEILVIENDQREDVHPLEEAAGYQALLKLKGYDVQRIADRIGRSAKYVYDRVKLLQLTKEAQRLFLAGTITAGHAIILARLRPEDQARALDPDNRELWHHEHRLYDPDDESEDKNPYAHLKLGTVRELQTWVDEHVRFEIAAPPDPMLFPETHETLQEVLGEGEKLVPITHEILTPEDVKDGGPRPVLGRSWKRADGAKGSKPCEHAVMGVIVIGRDRGEAFKVCTRKDKCLVHWKELVKAREKREKAAASGKPVAGTQAASRDRIAEQRVREQAEEAKEQAIRDRWKKATPAILEALAARVKTMPVKADGFLAQTVLREMNVSVSAKAAQLVPRGSSTDDLIRHLAFLALADKVDNDWWGPREFPKLAKSFGLDVGKILDEAAPVEQPKTKPAKGKKEKAA